MEIALIYQAHSNISKKDKHIEDGLSKFVSLILIIDSIDLMVIREDLVCVFSSFEAE